MTEPPPVEDTDEGKEGEAAEEKPAPEPVVSYEWTLVEGGADGFV